MADARIRRPIIANLPLTCHNTVDVDLHGDIAAYGEESDHETDTRIGKNISIPSTTFILLSNVTSAAFPFNVPAAEQQMQIVSDSANDTAAGTGAQQVEIIYFNSSASGWQKKTEIVTLNGVTPVLTVATDIYRIDRFRVSRVGVFFTAGNVSLQNTLGTVTFERIDVGTNFFRSCIHWVPKGFQTVLKDVEKGVTTAGGVTFVVEGSKEDSSGNVVTYGRSEVEFSNGAISTSLAFPIVVSNPNGKEMAIAIVVRGKTANQSGTATMGFMDQPIC